MTQPYCKTVYLFQETYLINSLLAFLIYNQISTNEQNHNTRGTKISKPVKETNYVPYSIKHKSTDDWDKLQKRNFMNFNITAITFSWKKMYWISEKINVWYFFLVKYQTKTANKRAIPTGCTSLFIKFSISLNNLKFAIYIFIIFFYVLLIIMFLS